MDLGGFANGHTSDLTTEIGLPAQYDEIFPLMVARQLTFDDQGYDVVQFLDAEINKLMGQINKQKKEYGQRATSAFKRSLNGEALIW